MLQQRSIHTACRELAKGGVIVYPTEAVFGLGCDPYQPKAVARLLQLKKRDPKKGLILIAARMAHLKPLLRPLDPKQQQQLQADWPGPVTWLVPDPQKRVPNWIRGSHASVALRVTDHPIAAALCECWGGAIVSTSANVSGFVPVRTLAAARRQWRRQVDAYVVGAVGGRTQPSEIRDLASGRVIRAGDHRGDDQ